MQDVFYSSVAIGCEQSVIYNICIHELQADFVTNCLVIGNIFYLWTLNVSILTSWWLRVLELNTESSFQATLLNYSLSYAKVGFL